MITLKELFAQEVNPFQSTVQDTNPLYSRLGYFLQSHVNFNEEVWRFHTYTTFPKLGSVHFFFKNTKDQTIAIRVSLEEVIAFQIKETAIIAKDAYEAGHAECLEDWSSSEGIQVLPYDECFGVWDEPPQRDPWIQNRLLQTNAHEGR